ncbi:hypothetical protein DPM33_19455 [Mesorhizobium hawassense]|uniref:Uncharacterized protein n=1 Tax=Mesorhizobium hawassense TaxID=1209954 RepID=A0A330HN38_9HYPH|nr:hypothetical protein [Mesorhizobium hawassense]RAZ89138.1 hypothetical protein DPM33_19455 [Mesorhizobium hawassense]
MPKNTVLDEMFQASSFRARQQRLFSLEAEQDDILAALSKRASSFDEEINALPDSAGKKDILDHFQEIVTFISVAKARNRVIFLLTDPMYLGR